MTLRQYSRAKNTYILPYDKIHIKKIMREIEDVTIRIFLSLCSIHDC